MTDFPAIRAAYLRVIERLTKQRDAAQDDDTRQRIDLDIALERSLLAVLAAKHGFRK